MNFYIEGHSEIYLLNSISQLFFPNEPVNIIQNVESIKIVTGPAISSTISNGIINTKLYDNGILLESNEENITRDIKYHVKHSLFILLSNYTDYKPAWGMMTGVKPSKLFRSYMNDNNDYDFIYKKICSDFLISKDKFNIAYDVAKKEMEILSRSNSEYFSLYIDIPFCPTKCKYCSFSTYEIKKIKDPNIVDVYIEKLCDEIKWVKENINKKLYTIYIGGGTPTALNEKQLNKLLCQLDQNFNLHDVSEFTVECGRPDTINEEKLLLLKQFNVNRIAINPQTCNDITLQKIGRFHTTKEFIEKFRLARRLGFNNINIDIIIGLVDEKLKDVKNTLNLIKKLDPESLTVHTLSIKRGSYYKYTFNQKDFNDISRIENMLKITREYANNMNLTAYYMYRQKNMLGNFENIGYSKKDFECIYNVEMMENRQDIIGLGLGSTSKSCENIKNNKIYNFKNINDYINRFDEQLKRKEDLFGR